MTIQASRGATGSKGPCRRSGDHGVDVTHYAGTVYTSVSRLAMVCHVTMTVLS